MKVTLTPKVKEIIASQMANGSFANMDEAVNSLILSTQDVIDHRLDGLGPEIAERISQLDSDDINVDGKYFKNLKNKYI